MPAWLTQDFLTDAAVVSSFSRSSLGAAYHNTAAPGSATWPAANRAICVPCRIVRPTRVAQLWWHNGTKVGTPNVDCGIYSADGRLLISTGSTAQGTSSVVQAVNVTDADLAPGLYYLALAVSVSNSGIFRTTTLLMFGRALGMAQQATALPLPATATFEAIASNYLPIFGFTSRATL